MKQNEIQNVPAGKNNIVIILKMTFTELQNDKRSQGIRLNDQEVQCQASYDLDIRVIFFVTHSIDVTIICVK